MCLQSLTKEFFRRLFSFQYDLLAIVSKINFNIISCYNLPCQQTIYSNPVVTYKYSNFSLTYHRKVFKIFP